MKNSRGAVPKQELDAMTDDQLKAHLMHLIARLDRVHSHGIAIQEAIRMLDK